MITIIAYSLRQTKEGKPFVSLELEGDLILLQSKATGRYYASTRKATISSTFTEQQAKALIGRELPGRIERVSCEPYEYTIQETGEVIQLAHRYEYTPGAVKAPATISLAPYLDAVKEAA